MSVFFLKQLKLNILLTALLSLTRQVKYYCFMNA